jgi:hypothetical protein
MPEMIDTSATLRPVARLLPPEEWAEKTPDLAAIRPEGGFVVVVEDGGPGGQILASWGAFTAVHVEGLGIAPEAAGHAGVGRALLSCMVEALVAQGVQEVLTQADSEVVRQMIAKAGGQKIPGESWVIPLTGSR